MNNNTNPINNVVMQAKEELVGLIKHREEVTKRIGTIKLTLAGLANLFGNQVLDDELLEMLDRKTQARPPGFTDECRHALIDSQKPMTVHAVREWIQEKNPTILMYHKDPQASVATVLKRLVDYGEAESLVLDNGKRAWQWRAELPSEQRDQEHHPSAP